MLVLKIDLSYSRDIDSKTIFPLKNYRVPIRVGATVECTRQFVGYVKIIFSVFNPPYSYSSKLRLSFEKYFCASEFIHSSDINERRPMGSSIN